MEKAEILLQGMGDSSSVKIEHGWNVTDWISIQITLKG